MKQGQGHKYWKRDPEWTPMWRTKQEWLPISRWEYYRIGLQNFWRRHKAVIAGIIAGGIVWVGVEWTKTLFGWS